MERRSNLRRRHHLRSKRGISKYNGVFTKGYLPTWSNEVFDVFRVQPTVPVTYILKANNGEIIQGEFYGHELLKLATGDVYLIERMIKRKGDKYLVRWLGFMGVKKSVHVNNYSLSPDVFNCAQHLSKRYEF